MCRYAVQTPVSRAATTFHVVPRSTLTVRWVELVGGTLALEAVAQSSGESRILDLRALEQGSARGCWLAEAVLTAVTTPNR